MKTGFWTRVAFLLIIIVAAFLRLYKLDIFPPGLYPDEAINGNNALEALSTRNFKVFYPENNGREGLFINLQAFSIALFGNTPWALRLVSAIFGILTVWGMYLFGKTLIATSRNADYQQKWVPLFASFFLATSFWHINFSRIGFRAISAPFFLVFGFYFLLKGLNAIQQQSKTFYLPFLLAGILFGFGFYTYIAYRFLPILLILFLWLFWRGIKSEKQRRQFLFYLTFFGVALFLSALPIGLYFVFRPEDFVGRAREVSVLKSSWNAIFANLVKTLAMFTFVGDHNWRHNYSGWPLLSPLVAIPFLIGFVVTLGRMIRERFKNVYYSLPLLWFFIMLGANFLSPEGSPHALRALVVAPAVFMIAAIGAEWLWLKYIANWQRNVRLAIVIAFVALLPLAAWYEYFIRWAPHPETANAFSTNYVREAKLLINLPPETYKYIITNGGGIEVRGLPASAQTIIYLLGGWDRSRWNVSNVYFVSVDAWNTFIPQRPAVILLMQDTQEWKEKIYSRFPSAVEIKFGDIRVFKIS
jgi:4-amino-4-deoxy-L-arabinose transferase-like glycosyltransferase